MITATIEPIKAYSIYHFLFCLGLIALAVLIVYFLKKVNKTAVITAIGIVLVAIEVTKQIFIQQIYTSYSWSDVPFQLCSVPMYLCLLYPVAKKLRETIENFLRSFCMMGAIVAFAIPCDVFSKYLALSIQSIVWHELLLILGVYCIASSGKDKKLGFKDYRNNALLYLVLAFIAMSINALLKDVSSGTANMFFLGPSYPYMVYCNNVCDKFGWVVESILMICASEAGGAVVLLLGELAKKGILNIKKGNKEPGKRMSS